MCPVVGTGLVLRMHPLVPLRPKIAAKFELSNSTIAAVGNKTRIQLTACTLNAEIQSTQSTKTVGLEENVR